MKTLATIKASGEDTGDPNHKRVALALGDDGDIWYRDIPDGEWKPSTFERNVGTEAAAIESIRTLWGDPGWLLRFEEGAGL